MTDPLYILFMLCLCVVLAEWLVRTTFARHLGTTLLVMVVAAVASNFGVIPTSTSSTPLYGGILSYVTPLAIFWLLLRVNLRDVLKAGLPMVSLYLIGAAGTAIGVVLAMWVVNGSESIGESYRGMGGVFVGTYTGGAVNFNALAMHYKINEQGAIFAGVTAVDNILTTVWMVATIAIPVFLARIWPRGTSADSPQEDETDLIADQLQEDTDSIHPFDLAILLAAAVASLWVSGIVADWLKTTAQINLPPIIILTTLALILAQLKMVQRWRGSQVLGMFSMYLFLAVIGASCDVASFREIGELGVTMLCFASLVILTHALFTFLAALLFRIDVDIAAIASQANIGGATTALGVARSLKRPDLAVPAVLVGSLGYAIGTYLGYVVAEYVL